MTKKLNPIERALVAAAGMQPPDARSVLMMICQSGMKPVSDIRFGPPSLGDIHYAKREKLIRRTKGAVDRVIDYAKHETLRKIEKHFRDTGVASAEGDPPKTLAEQLAYDKKQSADELAATLREEATVALATAGQQLFDEVGSDNAWKLPAEDAIKYLDSRENLFANASDEIHGEVMKQLQDGLESGETKKELMARISTAFDGIKQTRADTIANTETAAAFNFSRDKAMREAGVTHKKWLLSHSPLIKEHRITHVENDGQTVPLDDPFDIGGVKFMYPTDDSLGAGPEDIINCFPGSVEVSASRVQKSFRRFYEGPFIQIQTLSGGVLTVTPNHPMLTPLGWIPAGQLKQGGCLVRVLSENLFSEFGIKPNEQDQPSTLSEIHDTLSISGKKKRSRGSSMDFHGDGKTGEIDIVFSDSQLRHGRDSAFTEKFSEQAFAFSDSVSAALRSNSAQFQSSTTVLSPTVCNVSGGSVGTTLLDGELSHSDELRSGAVSSFNFFFDQPSRDDISRYSEPVSDGILRLASLISADEIINVEVKSLRGFVHNLETKSGWYMAQGYLTRNCHCVAIPTTSL